MKRVERGNRPEIGLTTEYRADLSNASFRACFHGRYHLEHNLSLSKQAGEAIPEFAFGQREKYIGAKLLSASLNSARPKCQVVKQFFTGRTGACALESTHRNHFQRITFTKPFVPLEIVQILGQVGLLVFYIFV